MSERTITAIMRRAAIPGIFECQWSPAPSCLPEDLPLVYPFSFDGRLPELKEWEDEALARLLYVSKRFRMWVGVDLHLFFRRMDQERKEFEGRASANGVILMSEEIAEEEFLASVARHQLASRLTFGASEWLTDKLYRLGWRSLIPTPPSVASIPGGIVRPPSMRMDALFARQWLIRGFTDLQQRGFVATRPSYSETLVIFPTPEAVAFVLKHLGEVKK